MIHLSSGARLFVSLLFAVRRWRWQCDPTTTIWHMRTNGIRMNKKLFHFNIGAAGPRALFAIHSGKWSRKSIDWIHRVNKISMKINCGSLNSHRRSRARPSVHRFGVSVHAKRNHNKHSNFNWRNQIIFDWRKIVSEIQFCNFDGFCLLCGACACACLPRQTRIARLFSMDQFVCDRVRMGLQEKSRFGIMEICWKYFGSSQNTEIFHFP